MNNFFAIDFETATGERYSACSLAIVKVSNNTIVARHNWMIRPPENKYSSNNIAVHGITPDMTEHIEDISHLHPTLMQLLDGQNVVAHSIDFDWDVLIRSLAYYDLPAPKPALLVCTCRLSGTRKLNDCCEEFGILLKHHDALSDAEACAKLYLALKGIKHTPEKREIDYLGRAGTKISADTLKAPDLEEVKNKTTIFFDKKVVITGTFENYPIREQLARTLKSLGADIQKSISKRTDIVVIGVGAGPAKMKKIDEINQSGAKTIITMNEEDLTAVLKNLEDEKTE